MFSLSFNRFFLISAMLAVLAGCTSTGSLEAPPEIDSSVGTGSGAGADGGVSTGGAETGGLYGEELGEDGDVAGELDTVFYFDFDQSTLNASSREALIAQSANLVSNPRTVRLEGHADERGTREYNMALGERRAKSVRDFMVLQGVDATLIEMVSYGEEYPAVNGSTEEAYAMNRRVELK